MKGDHNCHEFTINPKQFRTWNSILLHITDVIQPNFGAIRRLISLRSNEEVWNYDDLSENDKYIGFGSSSQTQLNPKEYRTNQELELERKKSIRKVYAGPKHFGDTRFISELQKKNVTVIYATLNGVNDQPPQKVVFNRFDFNNWYIIINYLSRILSIPEGIGKICTIHGISIKDTFEFQPGYLYVVVPNNHQFLRVDYLKIFDLYRTIQNRMKMIKRGGKKKFDSRVVQGFVKIQNVD